MQAQNVWSPVYVNALVLRDQSSESNGVLDQRLYVVQDANWNVTALLDTSGNVVVRYTYDPYGTVTVLNPDWINRESSAYAMPYLWQGELRRHDGHVSYADARVSPTLGRPLQADPLGLVPDNNDYRWEGDAPTKRDRPFGPNGPGPIFVRRPHGWRPPPPAPFNWDAGLKTGAVEGQRDAPSAAWSSRRAEKSWAA